MNDKIISDVMQKMISYSEGNLHDIAHFMKVYAFAHTIGIGENIPDSEREILEIAAILHDIACPLCREKYGNTNGKYQEKEGGPLTEDFLGDFGIPQYAKERIIYLVSHHHTYTDVHGLDYRILLEADFLVNADESSRSKEAIQSAENMIFQTETGRKLLENIYCAR